MRVGHSIYNLSNSLSVAYFFVMCDMLNKAESKDNIHNAVSHLFQTSVNFANFKGVC